MRDSKEARGVSAWDAFSPSRRLWGNALRNPNSLCQEAPGPVFFHRARLEVTGRSSRPRRGSCPAALPPRPQESF